MQFEQFKNQVLVFKNPMYRLAFRILNNEEDAKDIVQDSFAKLWDKREVLTNISNLKSFILTIVRNASIDSLRKHKPEVDRNSVIINRPEHQTPESQLVISDQLKWVREIINGLNEQQRELIQLRDIEGLDYDEISEISGLTANNARVIISRARKEIRLRMLDMN
jgi:RNA polymerase sigma-70 factor (ECF subfamily)